ncbi:MAG: tRNA lysidine(34) synthetase TilS [Ignavibacteriaceae bacterium]
MNPSLDFTIFNSSEVFKNQLGIIEVELKKNSKKIFKFEDNILKISLLELQKVKSEMWGELFKFEIGRNFPVKFKFNDLRKILSLIKNESGKKIEISNGLFAFREREELLIKKEKHDFFNEVKIKIDDEVKVDKKVLEISLSKKKMEQISRSKLIDKRTIEYISSDKIKGGFILRRWKKGDIFFPLGLNGSKKISDFLNEKKIESNKKVNQLVLTNQNKIVWVVGLRLDERFKIDKNTKKVLKLCLK